MEMTTWMVGTGDLTDDVWDFVFRNTPLPKKSKIPQKTLEKMRKEFRHPPEPCAFKRWPTAECRFWYPMDLRVSGKDLIQNHLTMAGGFVAFICFPDAERIGCTRQRVRLCTTTHAFGLVP